MANETQISEGTLLQIVLTLVALILPPLAVLPKVGLNTHFWINVLLTLFGWLPGLIHALWIVWRDVPTLKE